MSSPFPGVDPYIETPELWPDFHNNLASEIQAQLNDNIQPDYFARLTPYVTYEVIEISQTYGIWPDVAVVQTQPPSSGGIAMATEVTPAPVQSKVALEVPLRLHRIEIKATDTQELVTIIEILSPVNKRPGHDAYRDYRRKRRDILRSSVHLLEIDLLRGGKRPPLEEPLCHQRLITLFLVG